MRKVLLVLMALLIFFVIPEFKVEAIEDSFYEGEYISGEYIKKFKSGATSGKYQQMRFFRRSSDNQPVYCIELWETLANKKNMIGYDSNQAYYSGFSDGVWDRVMLIAYYGYGYSNHTEDKWYAITQYMIWKTTSPDSNIYFTNTLNGSKITKYQNEMNEINTLINNHYNKPSFAGGEFQIRYNEDYQLIDTNNELSNFNITNYNTDRVNKNSNILTINSTRLNNSMVELTKAGTRFNNNPIVYIDSESQNILAAGNFNPVKVYVNYNLPTSTITVNKLDKDSNIQGDQLLKGSVFQLLDLNNNVLQTQTISDNKSLEFTNVGYGTYKIKEIKAGTGYLINNDVITVDVSSKNIEVNFYNQVISNEIVFQKYIRNSITGISSVEEGAKFSIYNSSNQLVHTFSTDKDGKYQIKLPYGKYTVKQISGVKNHLYVDDFIIDVNTDGKTQTINLYNEELTANIKIINTDSDSNLPILEGGASFKIIGSDQVLTTNDSGNTNILVLSSGSYEVKQISVVDGYVINDNIFKFNIDDNTEFKYDENGNRYIEVIVPNDKKTSKIEIDKIVEYYLDDELVSRKRENDFTVSIYAKEDIYSKDGVKLYSKDEEVGQAILSDKYLLSDDIYFGTYYIKNPIDQTIMDIVLDNTDKKHIDIMVEIYEYTKENKKEDIVEIDKPIIEEYYNEVIEEKVEVEELITKPLEGSKVEVIITDSEIEIDEEEIVSIDSEIVSDLEDTSYQEIIVPNTYSKKSLLSDIGSLLIILGLIGFKRKKSL